jgi:hypothetical protein
VIPLYVDTPGLAEPPEALYHVVAANGTFLVNRTALFTAVTPARTLPGLLRREPSIQLAFPRVPRLLMERIHGFFKAVYRAWEGEAIVFIFYAPAAGTFHVGVPPQVLVRRRTRGRWRTQGRVFYGYLPRGEGLVKLGDAHSHGSATAAWSCQDDADDATQDGLKIVLGQLDRRHPDVSVSFVTQRTRFLLRSADVIEDFSAALTPPLAWLRQVTCRHLGEVPGGSGRPANAGPMGPAPSPDLPIEIT